MKKIATRLLRKYRIAFVQLVRVNHMIRMLQNSSKLSHGTFPGYSSNFWNPKNTVQTLIKYSTAVLHFAFGPTHESRTVHVE